MGQIKGKNDLTVASGLEPVGSFEGFLQVPVIVDLTIHRENRVAVCAIKGLRSAFDIDDRQTLMGQHRATALKNAGPIRATVPLELRAFQGKRPGRRLFRIEFENREDGAHTLKVARRMEGYKADGASLLRGSLRCLLSGSTDGETQ